MHRGLLAFLLGVACLGAGGSALAHQLAVSARAELSGSGTSYRLTVVNTGDEPILCFGLLLDGVQPTSATGPAGVLTRVGTFQGRGLVHMQGSAAAPVVRPGETVIVDFRTNVAVAAGAGGEIRYSPTCLPGSDQIGRAAGPTPPPAPPPPPPAPTPCVCKDLKTRIVGNRSSVTRSDAQGFSMELLVEWNLTCTKGAGSCTGALTLVPSTRGSRLGVAVSAPAGTVSCQGPCAKTTRRFQRYVVTGGTRWASGKRGRADKLIRFQMKRTCRSTRIPQTFDVVFNRSGGIDTRLSDLNGNGIADRRDS